MIARRIKHFIFYCAALALVVVSGFQASAQTVIYRETFSNSVAGSRQTPNLYGWQAFLADGTFFNTTSGGFGVDTGNSPGNSVDVGANVNAGPNNTAEDFTALPGARMFWNGDRRFVWTPEYPVDPSLYVPGSIQFSVYIGNQQLNVHERIAVRTNNAGVENWYFSTTDFTSAAVASASFATLAELKTFTYDTTAANWQILTFDGTYNGGGTPIVDSPVAIATNSTLGALATPGVATSNLSGTITAFGIISVSDLGDPAPNPAANVRFDTFQISATPIGGGPVQNANFDGLNGVDGKDFLIWQRGLGLAGQTTNANGDADGLGTVDAADLAIWRSSYGAPATPVASSIPEPCSLGLLVVAAIGLAARRRRQLAA